MTHWLEIDKVPSPAVLGGSQAIRTEVAGHSYRHKLRTVPDDPEGSRAGDGTRER
jgi:hypothetical protein